jgi:hypothetical protein
MLLRPVQPRQAQHVGIRRRCQRRLPAPARLDTHHPAPQGHRRGVPRRPRPDRLLEPAARQEPAPARPQHPAPAQGAARPLRHLRGPAPARRPGATHSRGMATMAPHHPQSDHQAAHRRTRAGQHPGGHPSRTHLLPAPGNQRRQPGTGIFTHLNRPPGLARAGCGDDPQVRFLAAYEAVVNWCAWRWLGMLVWPGGAVACRRAWGWWWWAGACGRGVPCPGPPALPSFQAGFGVPTAFIRACGGGGAAHAQKRVLPEDTASFAPGRRCAPAVVMRPSRSPPGRDGAGRRRWRRPRGRGGW